MTATTVTDISAARSLRKPAVEVLHTISMPMSDPGMARLQQAIERAGLAYDARAIWMGYPNMEQATIRLMKLYSADWPSRRDATSSAVIEAVLAAIRNVKTGWDRDERTRDLTVANFLDGIGSIADDVAGVCAWGYEKDKPIEQYASEKGSFLEWTQASSFTEVRFYFAEEQSQREIDGTRWKLLCAVASTKDVGIVHRYKK